MEPGIMLFINCKDCPVEEQAKILKSIGVNHTFLAAGHERLPEVFEKVREVGLICDNFHGNFNDPDGIRMNDIHKEGEKGDIMLKRLKKNILNCARFDVPKLVVHISDDKPHDTINKWGDIRYKELGDFARENGVTLLFENTAGYIENFEYMWKLIPDAQFCWDNGHNSFCSPDKELMKPLGYRLGALHITDNSGLRDDHYIPFDGIIDYEKVTRSIAESGYDGTMMLELAYGGKYAEEMSYTEFALKAKAAAERLIDMVKSYR